MTVVRRQAQRSIYYAVPHSRRRRLEATPRAISSFKPYPSTTTVELVSAVAFTSGTAITAFSYAALI
ncbi:hypothetical protein O6P43_003026 [Quillaja saponaria]|uniref:Uncharacterized protein n=1 Tax=Quillaja saponaria TaxID=32244 RepID=A0AAD7QE39_QUISA|nr:hypothetical protein O6P43_003026 [Quillaja saponaria]